MFLRRSIYHPTNALCDTPLYHFLLISPLWCHNQLDITTKLYKPTCQPIPWSSRDRQIQSQWQTERERERKAIQFGRILKSSNL